MILMLLLKHFTVYFDQGKWLFHQLTYVFHWESEKMKTVRGCIVKWNWMEELILCDGWYLGEGKKGKRSLDLHTEKMEHSFKQKM